MTYHLISWGANSHGQLGQGIRSEECVEPKEVDLSRCDLDPRKIKKITGGAGHTLILDEYGRVYSCGWNNKGQAGVSERDDVLSLQQVPGPLRDATVVDVACGWDSSAALTEEGLLYLWGSNAFGQLGVDPNVLRWTHDPFKLHTDRRIKRVSMGLRHTALISESCKVLVSGSNGKGQLGLDSPPAISLKNIHAFTEISAITAAEEVACGQHHTVVITKDGDLYAIGDNKHGQLGVNPSALVKTTSPIKVSNLPLKATIELYAGWSHTILLNENEAVSWGRNTYGQLGSPDSQRPRPWEMERVAGAGKIRQIAVGSEHNVALTEDGIILCWGWNEHGNCGNGSTRDVLFPERIELAFNYDPILVGAGAGHSLAVVKKE